MSLTSLLADLADPSQPLRSVALAGLSALDRDGVAEFRSAWASLPAERRRQILARLTELAEDNIELDFDAVYFAGLADEDANVRALAVRGLWECEDHALLERLLAMVEKDSDARVRAEAALGLGRYAILAEFEHLNQADAGLVDAALRRVATRGDEVAEVRGRALEALGARSLPWVTDLIREAYRGSDRRLKVSAVHAMGRSCDALWLDDVVREFASDDPEMRYEAAMASGEIGEESFVPHLAPLMNDDDPEVQEAAIHALGEIGGREARKALEQGLDTRDQRVREAIEDALIAANFNEDPLGLRPR